MARPTRSSWTPRRRAEPSGRPREAAPVVARRSIAVADGTAAPALALALLVVAAYLPVLRAGFIWDDDAYVTANATLRTFGGLRRIWLEPGAVPQYYPLTFTSLWLDYHLWGLQPLGYHLVNVLLHAANVILVWLVGRRLALPGAWFAAAVFAVHPVHVESVAWGTERKNVLSGGLYLAAFLDSRWRVDAAVWWQYSFPLAATAAVAALYLARRRIGSGPLVAALCYAATLAPALGFINVYPMRYSFVADHFQYLASLPLIALAAAAGATRAFRPRQLGGVVLLALGVLTWRQALVYRDAETVWRDTLVHDPDSSMAHVNLGMLLSDDGRVPEAIVHFREALRIDPADGEAHNDLGNTLAAQGKLDQAIAEYGAALGMKGDHALIHNNLGNALAATGRPEEAAAPYREATPAKPGYADPHSNLGNVLAATEPLAQGTAQYEAALRLRS